MFVYGDHSGGQVFVVWDVKNQNEYTSYIQPASDNFVGYFTGSKSKIGYLGFYEYIINLDQGLPNPYFGIDGYQWNNKGPMIDD